MLKYIIIQGGNPSEIPFRKSLEKSHYNGSLFEVIMKTKSPFEQKKEEFGQKIFHGSKSPCSQYLRSNKCNELPQTSIPQV